MAVEVETQKGQCETHGTVEATREIPKFGFPWIVSGVRRSLARRHPFTCPECGEPVETA
jgi:hypothetical protein